MSEPSIAAAWPGASGVRSAPRAHEAVAHELRVLILAGHFAVGDRLPSERQLANRYGVSRPTVREALGVLESHGLVHTRKGSGTFVADHQDAGETATPPDKQPAELMETRLVLEVAVARLAGKRARMKPDGLEEVRVTVEALERVANPSVVPRGLDTDFHRAVARLTGNDYLICLLDPMWAASAESLICPSGQAKWSAEDTRRMAGEHRGIYEALAAGDPELAAFAMERHLRALMATIFENEPFEGPPPRFFA